MMIREESIQDLTSIEDNAEEGVRVEADLRNRGDDTQMRQTQMN